MTLRHLTLPIPGWHPSFLVLLAILALLSGCATTPSVENYVLSVEVQPRDNPNPAHGVLLVGRPQAQPGYDSEGIAYTRNPLQVEYYTRSRWADSPGAMLEPLLVSALEGTGGFRAVVADTSPALPDLRLDTDIIQLRQEFIESPSQVRLTVRAKLFDLATNHVLGTQLFEIVETAPSDDAYGGVVAANQAVARLLNELGEFVLRYAGQR